MSRTRIRNLINSANTIPQEEERILNYGHDHSDHQKASNVHKDNCLTLNIPSHEPSSPHTTTPVNCTYPSAISHPLSSPKTSSLLSIYYHMRHPSTTPLHQNSHPKTPPCSTPSSPHPSTTTSPHLTTLFNRTNLPPLSPAQSTHHPTPPNPTQTPQ